MDNISRNKKKHAYLIIAHNNIDDLSNLLVTIDDVRNDIFIHIDKKWKNFNFEYVKKIVKFSRIVYTERIGVKWGGYSLVECEMMLFKTAFNFGEYDYYHLLSGQDLAIKSQDQIHEFFDKNFGKEFLSFSSKVWQNEVQVRVKYYFLQQGKNIFLAKLNRIYLFVQKKLGINRIKKSKIEIVGGCNWCSLTGNAVRFLIENEKTIKKIFGHGFCVDELFVHTILYNSKFKDNIYLINFSDIAEYSDTERIANLRYIDWTRGEPYTFTLEDFNLLINSPCFFSRKFSNKNNPELSKKILDYVLKK